MKSSRYLAAFKNVDMSALTHELVGDALLVEKITQEEIKTAGGIIMATSSKQVGSISSDLPTFVHVLSVGKGYYNDETGEPVELNVQAGDIVLVGSLSVKWFSMLEVDGYEPFSIGLSREAEIQLRFKGLEGYQNYFKALNSRLKAKMEPLPGSLL